MFEDKIRDILSQGYICDYCLGRQFAQLLSGTENRKRGEVIRYFFALMLESGQDLDIQKSNFYDFDFRKKDLDLEKDPDTECFVCSGLFERVDTLAGKALAKLQGYEFDKFLVGTRLPDSLIEKEEKLWASIGIEHCEQMKADLNREIGKKICERTGKDVDFELPQIVVLVDIENDVVELNVNSLCVYGEYNKLKRGIPQTRWPSGKYDTSVEEIIAEYMMKGTEGTGHKFHGAGREDIDAKCLGWRPFIFEILEPVKRGIDLKEVEAEMAESEAVNIRNLSFVDRDKISELKEWDPDKSYRAKVKFVENVKDTELDKLKNLETKIRQRTPQRVSHRRADRYRHRMVKNIEWERVDDNTIDLFVRAEAGTYIKELISGDAGRSEPSVSGIIGVDAECVELDVVEIHNKDQLQFV